MVTEHDDRGQLILITAIAIAFILLAIVIVFNGLLFTQTIASEQASKAVTDVGTTERELERGVQGIAQRTNVNASADLDAMNDSIESFESEYRNVTASSKPMIVDTSIDDVDHALFTNGSTNGTSDQMILNATTEANRSVGYFVLTPQNSSAEITFNDGEQDCTITDEADFVTGQNVSGDCVIDPSSEFESIKTDDEVGYKLVVEGDESVNADPGVVDESEDAAWSVTVTYAYDSSDVTASKSTTVEIYEGVPDHAWPGGDGS